VSPGDPVPSQPVFFNASASTAPGGRRIVNYAWDFGNGAPIVSGPSPQATAVYPRPGTYTVTLVVTDEIGKTGVTTGAVAVAFPDAGLKAQVPAVK
jgi:PKD repeat protein